MPALQSNWTEAALLLISSEGQPGKEMDKIPPSPTHLLKPPECILFIFNFALFSTNSDPKLNKVKCIFLSGFFFFEEGVLTFQ